MSSAYFMKKFLEKRRQRKNQKLQNEETCRRNCTYDNIETNNISTKCRICLQEANIPIYNHEMSFDIPEAIRTFGGIELNEDDGYSQHVCTVCYTFLQNAVLFRKSAQDTDKIFRQTSVQEYGSGDDSSDIPDDDNHYKNDTHRKSYSCKLCNVSFESCDELTTHKNSKAHKSVRVQCPICLRLLTAQLFKKHLEQRHQSATHLICDICGKLYRKDNLVRHLQLHNYDLPFQCQICPYRGRFMESLRIHMRTHTGDKPFSCDKCELRFLTRSNLNRHLLTHKKEKPFKCIECGRGFYIKRDMESHFKADHVGVKEFNCRMCGNKYGTKKALMRHELRVHKRDKMAKGRVPLYLQAEYQKHDDGM